jgi:hypothetical protein
MIQVVTRSRFQTLPALYKKMQAILQYHGRSLVLLGVICLLIQIVLMTHVPFVNSNGDTPSYVYQAVSFLGKGAIFNATRTPVYPLFIALIFCMTGGYHLEAIIVVQTVLLIASVFEWYAIAYLLLKHSLLATGITALLALNVYAFVWARVLGSESLAMWLATTLFLVLALHLKYKHPSALLWFTVFGLLIVLTRPYFLYLPYVVIAALAVYHARCKQFAQIWRRLLLALLVISGGIGLWVAGNAWMVNYSGISVVGDVNLFGKVIEYHMQDETQDPRFTQLRVDLHTFTRTDHEPWDFLIQYPQYMAENKALLRVYTQDIVEHHPMEFVVKSLSDFALFMLAPPEIGASVVDPSNPPLVFLEWVSFPLRIIYCFVPFLLISNSIRVWRHAADPRACFFWLLSLALTGSIVMGAMGAYHLPNGDAFYRLRSILDEACLLVIFDAILVGMHKIRHWFPWC